jgi:hypothetical protein
MHEDVLRARHEATARLPLRRADYARAAAGTDDDGNDDIPGLRRMRARLRRGRASESQAHRPYAGRAKGTHASHAEPEREAAPGAHARATPGQARREGSTAGWEPAHARRAGWLLGVGRAERWRPRRLAALGGGAGAAGWAASWDTEVGRAALAAPRGRTSAPGDVVCHGRPRPAREAVWCAGPMEGEDRGRLPRATLPRMGHRLTVEEEVVPRQTAKLGV